MVEGNVLNFWLKVWTTGDCHSWQLLVHMLSVLITASQRPHLCLHTGIPFLLIITCLPVCMSVCLPACVCMSLSVCLFVYLSVCLSSCLSTSLPVYLSTYIAPLNLVLLPRIMALYKFTYLLTYLHTERSTWYIIHGYLSTWKTITQTSDNHIVNNWTLVGIL